MSLFDETDKNGEITMKSQPAPGIETNLKPYQVLIVLACLLVCTVGIFDREVWTPDEPRVAAMALEMHQTGNYVVPHLAGTPFVEKPPLYFVVGSLCVGLFSNITGIAGAVRLSTLLWGLGVLVFTWFTAKRLFDRETALLATAALATMAGFVENFHWIRVDAALACLVMGTVWSLVEGFCSRRPAFFLLSGTLSAGAFLSKGFIGPILIVIPAAALFFLDRFYTPEKRWFSNDLFFLFGGSVLFFLLSGIWVFMFKNSVDPEVWHEWFWVNHFGRASGEAVKKGHMYPGHPEYYVRTMLVYTLPWSPFVVLWVARIIKQFKSISAQTKQKHLFLIAWGVGSLIFLTIPSTKRDIYLLPVLPAYAMITAHFLRQYTPRWIRGYSLTITGISVFLLLIFTAVPLISRPFLSQIPITLQAPLSTFSIRNVLCGLGCILGIILFRRFRRREITSPVCIILASALLYTGAFLVPAHVLDHKKQILRTETENFVSRIPGDERSHIAGWKFSQTTRAAFYMYADWIIPPITSQSRLEKIIAGTDPEFTSVILNQTHSIPERIPIPHEVILEAYPRGSRTYRGIFWVKGKE